MSDTQNPTSPSPNKGMAETKAPASASTQQPHTQSINTNAPTDPVQTTHITNNIRETASTQTHQAQGASGTSIAFKSTAIGSRENARTKDYFAEQNKKTQEKKQKQSIQTRKALIIGGGILTVLVIAGLVWLIVILVSQPKEAVRVWAGEESDVATTTYEEAIEKSGMNDEEFWTGEKEADMGAADEVFNQAITEAKEYEDEALANQLLMAQIDMYFEQGDWEGMLRLAEGANTEIMSTDELARYYNYLANAYGGLENWNEMIRYNNLVDELPGGEYYGE